ncbi:MAG TPA: methionine--tRNA ligase subunit beta [Phycisphaerae bacterium]|nr:methionine--tRNA ligase subunit beta [Phycisphaerae bacterium]
MAEDKPIIQYEDFCKLDLRVAKVVEASAHPNADKLIVLKIDLGGEPRQIIAGLKAWYQPEELVGKSLVVVANLAPRKMRGLESQGMLLAASHMEGEQYADVVVLTTDRDVPPGSAVS